MRKKFTPPFLIFLFLFVLFADSLPSKNRAVFQESQTTSEKKSTLLKLLDLIPSPESIDYVQTKTSYQLHTLITEQRHSKTWKLSSRIAQDMESGLRMLFTADEDISIKLMSLDRNSQVLEQAIQAVEEAIISGHKIYVFGCQETGRWTKWMESSLWRPFWNDLQARKKIWTKVGLKVGNSIENRFIGEMPGADRSLISPLEGWEDLMVTGRLQLEERGIEPGDVVFCVTASGESPAVIGTIYEALDQWTRRYPYEAEKTKKKLFFFFNNPEETLRPFNRCRAVLEEPGISKINCTTGPQAIAGQTWMQAATIDTFLIAQILQAALDRTLRRFLSNKEMTKLGFKKLVVFAEKLGEFAEILRNVKKIVPAIAKFTAIAEKTYRDEHFTTYSALKGFSTVFNDCAERGQAFHLWPLDTVKTEPRKSRIQVWAPRSNQEEAWAMILGRPFRGLSPSSYKNRIQQEATNSDLLQAAEKNIKNAEDDQQFLYDFSFSDFNLRNRAIQKGDLGVLVVISPEEIQLKDKKSHLFEFVSRFVEKGARTAIFFITQKSQKDINKLARKIPGFDPDGRDALVVLPMNFKNDPLAINSLTALKIIMNAHSAAIMACSGKIIGNTVTELNPKNLKSIGRATALLLSHVNDVLKKPSWVKHNGIHTPISYGEANAVLFDAIRFMKGKGEGPDQSVALNLSIVRILESLRLNRAVPSEKALNILQHKGLGPYLNDATSQIK